MPCPECERSVSDRAPTCPNCGFPIAAHVAESFAVAQREHDRASRAHVGEVDCPGCEARGFVRGPEGFEWCGVCEHTGRVVLCRSARGYFAVARLHVAPFVAGLRDDGDTGIVYLGAHAPAAHRYPAPGRRVVEDEDAQEAE
jgi:RecJ-like exonuclease